MRTIIILASALVLATSVVVHAEGAIAVDDASGDKPGDAGYGIGYGDDKAGAQAAALSKCRASGNDACKVVLWFKKCGAYVSSAEKFGIGWGETENAAKHMALDSCGGDHCKVVASDCDD